MIRSLYNMVTYSNETIYKGGYMIIKLHIVRKFDNEETI